MARLSERVRYRGPTLSAAELARLAAEADPDRDRALAWHDAVRTFVDDRPLPADFARLPLPRQLDRLARSFHLEPPRPARGDPRRPWPRPSRATGPIRPDPAGRAVSGPERLRPVPRASSPVGRK